LNGKLLQPTAVNRKCKKVSINYASHIGTPQHADVRQCGTQAEAHKTSILTGLGPHKYSDA